MLRKKKKWMHTAWLHSYTVKSKQTKQYSLEMQIIDGKNVKKSKEVITTEIRTVVTPRDKEGRGDLGKVKWWCWQCSISWCAIWLYRYFFNNWLLYCTFYAIFTFHNVCYFIILNGLIKKESDYKEGKNERRNTCRQATIVDTQRWWWFGLGWWQQTWWK